MRLVRIKLKKDLRHLLGEIAHQHSVEDSGMTEDLFCLLRNKGAGLPTDERMEKMADVIAVRLNIIRPLALLSLRKRRYVLRNLVALPYFKALCMEHAAKPSAGVDRLLQTFREMTRKIRQAQCLTCQYRATCAFGTQFGDSVTDITKVVDPDYDKKVHADCPERPQITTLNQMAIFAQQFAAATPITSGAIGQTAAQLQSEWDEAMKAMEEELKKNPPPDDDDSDDTSDPEERLEDDVGLGVGGAARVKATFTATTTGSNFARVNDKLVQQLTVAKMVLFELGHQLNASLSKATKGKYKPTSVVSEKSEVKNLKSSTEISSVSPAQHALPDDMFNARVAKRSLQVRKFSEQEDKKFLLYVLVDISGSMSEPIGGGGGWGLVTRGQIASTLAIAMLTRVREDGGMVFKRFFEDAPATRSSARKKVEFEPLLRSLALADYNGGGTNVTLALRTALEDISQAKDEIRDCEILLITDGDDTIHGADQTFLVDTMKKFKIKLNTLNVKTSGSDHGNAAKVLPVISTKYLRVNPATVNLTQFVELVK